MKLTTAPFNESDTPAETVRKLNAMFRQLQERLDVDSVRVGNTTKLDHNGNVTCADLTCEDVDAEDVTCEDVVCEDVTAEDVTCADITGEDATFDSLTLAGTETDELIDVDRTIDANVTKDAVTVTETRAGVVAADGHAGFGFKSTIDATFATTHYGFRSEIDHDAGTISASYPFYAKINAATACGNSQLYAGTLAYDGEGNLGIPAFRAGLGLAVRSKSATELFGAYTTAVNNHTGDAVGYKGYGYNTGTAADAGAGDGYGLKGFAKAAEGLAMGVHGTTTSMNADSFAFVGEGHNHFSDGVTYIHTSDAAATVTNKTHIAETDNGSLWIENKLEVDGAGHFDSTLDVDGQADFNDDVVIDGELKGGRCILTAGSSSSNTSSVYLRTPGGITMSANRGYPMRRAGSLVGVEGQVLVAASTGGATCYIDVYLNGVLWATTDLLDCDLYVGQYREWGQNFARNIAQFVEHDVIAFYLRIVGSATIQYPIGVAELQFDT